MLEKIIKVGESDYIFQQELVRKNDDSIGENLVRLCGSDKHKLGKLASDILSFTKKIDPTINENFQIEDIYPPVGEMCFSLNVGKLFPSHILEVIGSTRVASFGGNCHGAALFVAGAFPALINIQGGLRRCEEYGSNLERVDNNKPIAGDVLCKGGPDDHSIVYINEGWCMSINGQSQNLELHSLAATLKLYESSSHLESGLAAYTVYRNNYKIPFSNEMLSKLSRWYKIFNNCSYNMPADTRYLEVQHLHNYFKNSSEGPKDQAFWGFLYKEIALKMPFSITHPSKGLQSHTNSSISLVAEVRKGQAVESKPAEQQPLLEQGLSRSISAGTLFEDRQYLILDVLSGYQGFGNNPWAVGYAATKVARNTTEEHFQSGLCRKSEQEDLLGNLTTAFAKLGIQTNDSLIFLKADSSTGGKFRVVVCKSVLKTLDIQKLVDYIKEEPAKTYARFEEEDSLTTNNLYKFQIVDWKCNRLLKIIKTELQNGCRLPKISEVQAHMLLGVNKDVHPANTCETKRGAEIL